MARLRQHLRTSDRERIALALGELADRGYVLPFAAWDICCSGCGWSEIARSLGAEDELPADFKTVWWDEQSDSYAFCDDPHFVPQTTRFLHAFAGVDLDEKWIQDHSAEVEADSIVARMTEFSTLRSPLFLRWRGDKEEVAAALRFQGLRVQVPDDSSQCVAVLPTHTPFEVHPVNGEVMVLLDGEETQLTAEDAARLARKISRAARTARVQMPVW